MGTKVKSRESAINKETDGTAAKDLKCVHGR